MPYAIVTYTNGSTPTASGVSNMRTIAISMADFEEENFPTTITNDVTTIAQVEAAWGKKLHSHTVAVPRQQSAHRQLALKPIRQF